jgi:acetoin utilization protein AcuC
MVSTRATAFHDEIKKRELIKMEGLTFHEPVEAADDDLHIFHSEKYIHFVRESSKLGKGFLDHGDTPSFKGVFEAASRVVGSTLSALDIIMNGKADHAFNPIGGLHHARRDAAAGFCVFNDAAIAISKAKMRYGLKRILYVDIDAHHGDGVFYAFYDDPKVFIADVHEDGHYLYPGTGFSGETGSGGAEGTKLPLSLPPGADDDQFQQVFKEVETFSLKVEPELILFQCGGDGLRGDPITHLGYTPKVHRFAAKKLHSIAHRFSRGRILAMGGGGYNVTNTAKAWAEVIEVFLGQSTH